MEEITEKKEDLEPIVKNKISKKILIAIISILAFCILLLIAFLGFGIYTYNSNKITQGVFIKDIEISNLTKDEAIQKVNNELQNRMADTLVLEYTDLKAELSLEQMGTSFDVVSAVDEAFKIGRNKNIFGDSYEVIKTRIDHISIEPNLIINEEELNSSLDYLSINLPDKVVQSSYYIEDGDLIITKGTKGNTVDNEKMIDIIKEKIQNLSYINENTQVEIKEAYPDSVDVDKIHKEIYKEPVSAYYTTDPFVVHPHENGVNFENSIDEVKQLVEQSETEVKVKLKYTTPEVTTNMIGTEAFPDLLSTFSTKYAASNTNRTTNLKLAMNKINGTVIMPGETFSYNTIVGERTIAAGYKEAAVYQNGQVVDGLGGGICQISTTLYNAALYANLEITDRRNHMFIPSYVGAGRDATVVYGSQDFKFKNNRTYPIKIVGNVSGGIAKFEIYGLKQEDDCEVEITTRITGSIPFTTTYMSKAGYAAGRVIQAGKNGTKSETYKTLKRNGEVISTEVISKDTYSAMKKIIAK